MAVSSLFNSLSPYGLIKYLFWSIMFALLVDVVLLVVNPEDIRGVESNPIYTVQQILEKNEWLYQDPEVAPYSITQYSPIYYVIADQFVSLFGVESSSPYSVRVLMRILSVLLSLLTVLLFYKLVHQVSKNRQTSLILSILFIVFCYPWNFIGRPDVLITFCYVTILYLIQQIADEKKPLMVMLVGAVCAIAVLSKLNGLLLFPISGLYFLLRKQRIRVLYLITGFALSILGILGLLILFDYDIGLISKNMFNGVNNGIDIRSAINKPYQNFTNYFLIFLIGSSFALIPNIKKGFSDGFDSLDVFVNTAILVGLPFSLLTALKVGSAINYFNDAMILVLIVWAIYLGRESSHGKSLAVNFLMIVGIQVGANHIFRYVPLHVDQIRAKYLTNDDNLDQTVQFLEQNLGESYFFSDQREVSMNVPHKSILFQMDIRNNMHDKNVYDNSNLSNSFKDGTVKYIVLSGSMYPILGVRPYAHYQLVQTFGIYKVYQHTTEKPSELSNLRINLFYLN